MPELTEKNGINRSHDYTEQQLDSDKNNVDIDELRAVARAGYADMLLDEERNTAYYQAIAKTVKRVATSNKGETVNITDIGTGTGLLAMMAVRSASQLNIPAQVTAYECFGPMAKCAESVINENAMNDNIQVLHMRGEAGRVTCESEKADILITELFDTELIGEGALPVYRSALLHLVKGKGASCAVPAKARIWIQLISSDSLTKLNQFVPLTVGDTKTGTVTMNPPSEVLACPGSGHLHDFQVNQLKPGIDFDFCSEPHVVFDYNFTDISSLHLMQSKELKIPLTRSARKSSLLILFWWDLLMDSDGEIILSLKPKFPSTGVEDTKVAWREHWIQAVYHLPACSSSNDEQILVSGSQVDLIASHDEFSLSFSIGNRIECLCSCGIHSHLSRSRIGVLNDIEYHQRYFDGIKKMMDETFLTCSTQGTILFHGDSSLVPILIAKRWSNCKVFISSPECSSTLFHNLFATENGTSSNCTLINSIESIGSKVDLLIMEPYTLAADLPFDHIDLWIKLCQNPHMNHLDMDHVLPNRVIIEMAAVQFNHLWKTKSKVGSDVQGFDLSEFDSLIQEAIKIVDPSIESYFAWEYPCRLIAKAPIVLFNWTWEEFQSFVYNEKSTKGTFEINASFIDPSLKHISFVFWTEFYHFDTLLHSTGPTSFPQIDEYISWPRNWKQGVSFEFLSDTTINYIRESIFPGSESTHETSCPTTAASTESTASESDSQSKSSIDSVIESKEKVTTDRCQSTIRVEYSANYHMKSKEMSFHVDLLTDKL